MSTVNFHSDYMNTIYDPRELRKRARQALKDIDFDTIVGIGISGTLPLMALADTLKVNYVAIRKPGAVGHAPTRLEGHLGHKWLLVDDFISSGTTFVNVHDAIEEAMDKRPVFVGSTKTPHTTECVGAFRYEHILPDGRYCSIQYLRDNYSVISKLFSRKEREVEKAARTAALAAEMAEPQSPSTLAYSTETDYQPVPTYKYSGLDKMFAELAESDLPKITVKRDDGYYDLIKSMPTFSDGGLITGASS